ncbi:uncharacterized protein LOC124274042 [Haliotis rubra]|uniref:uncharacterized protein LOC124274042 n=1 Tax=Haliotis rubra TaxID=36100 RepID=UPI001EE59F31|nr:uncharacterized protein LOC124274042 [Haliotis rubra]
MACMNQHIDDVTGDVSCERCFYIFLELEYDSTLSDEDKEKVDVALQSHFEFYHEIRSTSVFVDPVRIQVKSGTLDVIKQVNCDLNSKAAVQQYKYPKFTTKPELIRILLANKL